MFEKKENNNALYLTIIGILVVIIIIWAFFLGKTLWNWKWNPWVEKETTKTSTTSNSKTITITVIDDKRCKNCMTDQIVSSLKQVPFLAWAKIVEKEFSEEWVEDFIKENEISKLPAILLSTNDINDDGKMKPFLKQIKNKEYSLDVWASYDPYAKRSTKWFLIIDKDVITKIKENSYVKWNKNAKITWLEFSDVECPYCAKLHNSWVPEKIEEKYGDKLNVIFNHFPLQFHKNALPAAKIVECLAKETSWDKFYAFLKTAFKDEKSDKDYLLWLAVKLWAKKASITKCADSDEFEKKINAQQSFGASTFGITWTPGNVLINDDSWEYEVLSWAMPLETFESTIDSLLK